MKKWSMILTIMMILTTILSIPVFSGASEINKPVLTVSTNKTSYDYGESVVLTAVIAYSDGSIDGLAELYPDSYIQATLLTADGNVVPGFIVQGRNRALELECNFPLADDNMEAGDYMILVETNVEDLNKTTEVFQYTADKSNLPDPNKCSVKLTLSSDTFGFEERFTMTASVTDQTGEPASGVKVGFMVLNMDGSISNFFSYDYIWNITKETGRCSLSHTEGTGGRVFKPGKYIARAFIVEGTASDSQNFEYSLNELILPSSIEAIGEEAFANTSCQMVTIPDGCKSIGNRAFADCDDLKYVIIPSSVTNIADDAFEGCIDELLIERK